MFNTEHIKKYYIKLQEILIISYGHLLEQADKMNIIGNGVNLRYSSFSTCRHFAGVRHNFVHQTDFITHFGTCESQAVKQYTKVENR